MLWETARGEPTMEPSGEYRVTRHKGRGPNSKNAKVFYSHLDEAPAMRTYRKSVPPKSGYVVAVWRPDGSLIAFTTGEPSNTDMTRTEAEFERQLADAQTRIREMIREIDLRDELIADLQRRIQELEQAMNSRP
jgi:enamine deaminase RidA (YjgF/YER057c/UK114 family)